jgi:hypothetical protein
MVGQWTNLSKFGGISSTCFECSNGAPRWPSRSECLHHILVIDVTVKSEIGDFKLWKVLNENVLWL